MALLVTPYFFERKKQNNSLAEISTAKVFSDLESACQLVDSQGGKLVNVVAIQDGGYTTALFVIWDDGKPISGSGDDE